MKILRKCGKIVRQGTEVAVGRGVLHDRNRKGSSSS